METQPASAHEEQRIWLETIINKHANDKSIAKIINVDVKPAVPEGENYVSVILRATLTIILRNGQKCKTSVILKKLHEDEEKCKAFEEIPVFKVECTVYKEVLEKCESLMNEYEDFNEKSWCNLIGYRSNNLIVFEDLKLQNYILADRRKMLDLDHSKLVLHSLGRLHALCYVLIQREQLSRSDLAPFYCETDVISIVNSFKGGLKVLSNVIKKYWSPEWKEIGKSLETEQNCIMRKMKKLFELQENSFITMCHGDCWTPNLLFKYCPYDENYPVSVKFIDFQTSHVNSYIFDILHFLYVSVHPDIRRSKYDQLLAVYQKSLQSTLAIYGFEDRSPTLEHIHAEAERTKYYAFSCYLVALPVCISDVEGGHQVEKLNEGYDPAEAFHEDLFNNDLFKLNVQSDLIQWYNTGLFGEKLS